MLNKQGGDGKRLFIGDFDVGIAAVAGVIEPTPFCAFFLFRLGRAEGIGATG